MTPNTTGALLMMGAMACFTLNDTLIKLTGGTVPLGQLLFLRGVLSLVLIVALARWLGRLDWRLGGRDLSLIGVRSAAEVGAAYFFISALFHLPLANVTAILQALPLTVAIGAWAVLGEPLGWRRVLAIAIGFAGMLLIVRPGTDGFSVWSLYALAAVLCVTCRDLATRRLSAQVTTLTVACAAAISMSGFFGLLSLTEDWAPLTPRLGLLIVGASALIIAAYWLSVQTMRAGEIAFVAPFRYSGLLFALVLGWLVFDDWPQPLTLLGAAIVVLTGAFTLYRERVAARSGR